MGIKSYIGKRLIQIIPAVLAIVLINFFIVRLAPGDPAVLIAGQAASEQQIALIQKSLGLDKSLLEQFTTYAINLIQGDLGYSFLFKRPVTDLILERLPNTFILVGLALVISTIVGVTLGVITASKPHSFLDNFVSVFSLTGWSLPSFWAAQMFILLFAILLPIFPASGMFSLRESYTGLEHILDIGWHLILPVATLTLIYSGEQLRLTRGSMLEILSQDYIITARGKGVKERLVLFKHALKNALLPLITIIGVRIGFFFTGAVFIEIIYGWPGVGRLMYDSIFTRDYPIILGCFFFISIFVITAAFVVDLLYCYLDPRIRYR